ncbi:MAG: MFS transporter [Leptospiraceae bacterium]|nr:MFS transporter [Leptospiraceae bacterium]
MAVLQRLFKVYPGEERRLLLFTLLAALLQAGVAIGLSIADSVFLSRLGASSLPIVYVIAPIVMILFVPFLSFSTSRMGIDRVFDLIQYILIGGGFFFFLALSGWFPALEQSTVVLYLLRLYAYIWLVSLYTLFWNLVDGYFDILDAKRLYPIFGGGLSIGSALGGGLVTLFSGSVGSHWIFLLWPIMAVLSLLVAFILRRSVRKIEDEGEQEKDGFLEQNSKVMKTAGKSSYVLLINIIMFGTLVLTTFTEFQYLDIFAKGQGEEELASLFGQLFLVVNLINIVINFFLFNRIIVRIGVKNALLVQPAVYVLAFVFFYFDAGFNAALFGFLAYHGFYISFDANNWNFLFNAVPSEVKKEIRTFTEGLMDPLATALAGFLLLLAGSQLAGDDGWFTLDNLAVGGLALAFLHLGIAFLLRNRYPTAIMENLRKDWLNFSLGRKDLRQKLSEQDLESFQLESLNPESPAHLSSIRFLGLRRKAAALESLILSFSEMEEHQEDRADLLAELLEDEDSFVVQRVIQWAEQEQEAFPVSVLRELGSHGLIPSRKALPLLASEKPVDREAAVVALWNSRDLQDNFMALDELRTLLEGSEEEKASAITAFGFTGKESYAHSLVGYLDDPSAVMRSRALESIRMLVGPASSRLIPRILRAMEHASEEDRFKGIEILERIQDAESLFPLFRMAQEFNPRQRRRVEMFARSLGLKSVPAIVAVLGNDSLPHRSRSLAARTLSRLSFAQLDSMVGAIVEKEIQTSYLYLDRAFMLKDTEGSRAINLLGQFYKDMQQITLEFVLELLALAGRIPDYEQIAASLRSANPRTRGDSIETLEQSVPRGVFRMLLPLVDSRPLQEKIAFYHANFSGTRDSAQAILEKALKSKNDLEKALASQALYETRGEHSLDRIYRAEPFTGPMARAVYLSLSQGSEHAANPVERLVALKSDPLLGQLSILNLRSPASEAILHAASNTEIYARGDVAHALFIAVEGSFEVSENGTYGKTTGYEALERLGNRDPESVGRRRATVTMKEGTYLEVPLGSIEEMLESDPPAALGILEAMR